LFPPTVSYRQALLIVAAQPRNVLLAALSLAGEQRGFGQAVRVL